MYALVFGRWTSTDGWNQLPSPSCRDRSRIHHTTSSVVVMPGWMTARENASAMMPWAIATICGYTSSSSADRRSSQRTARRSDDFTRGANSGGSEVMSFALSEAVMPSP